VSGDPYQVLGVRSDASKEELHDAYRRLVKLHHPDRNGGSPESASRFREIQYAYDHVRNAAPRRRTAPPPPAGDPSVEARMADLERELREAQTARDRACQAARDAVRDATPGRPSDEALGYVTTDDSFSKILADVRDEVSDTLSGARDHPAIKRVSDLIDGLEGLASRFDRSRGEKPRD
jgi:curved DNA-binding protein CbpA